MATLANKETTAPAAFDRKDDLSNLGPSPQLSNSGVGARAQAVRAKRRAAQPSRAPAKLSGGAGTEIPSPIEASTKKLVIHGTPKKSGASPITFTALEACELSLGIADRDSVFDVVSPSSAIPLAKGEAFTAIVRFRPSGRGTYKSNLAALCTPDRKGSESLQLETITNVELVGNAEGSAENASAGPKKDSLEVSGPPKKRPTPKAPKETTDATEVEMIDVRDYPVEELGARILDQIIASFTMFDGALEIFSDVVSNPSKNEAVQAAAGSLAMQGVGDLLIKIAAKPLLKTLPGADALYETLKEGLAVVKKVRGAGADARRASEKNQLKDFTTAFRGQVTNSRASVESARQDIVVAVRRDYRELKTEGEREDRKLQLFAQGTQLKQSLSGELSVPTLFTRLVSSWMKHSTTDEKNPNRLIVDLDPDWTLITGYLEGPSGDRCAEQLMKLHGGSLNVPLLGLPVEVRWYSGRPMVATNLIRIRLSADGVYEGFRSDLRTGLSVKLDRMWELLKSNGIPEITKLAGRKSS